MPQLFVKRLTVIDFSYLDAVRGLVGESWQVDIELEGGLDEQGMVFDFGTIKKKVKCLIDEYYDHKLFVPVKQSGLEIDQQTGRSVIRFPLDKGDYVEQASPDEAILLVNTVVITPDSLKDPIINTIQPHMPDNVQHIGLHLWPELIDGAYYHYSHGLKHHSGNCQRIAHGHRSRIEILRNGQRDAALERVWAEQLNDKYIATRGDLMEREKHEGCDRLFFGYKSAQGEFNLSLPEQDCYLIDTDSTVENIAQHIAEVLKQRQPKDTYIVYAHEGIDKGAIGTA